MEADLALMHTALFTQSSWRVKWKHAEQDRMFYFDLIFLKLRGTGWPFVLLFIIRAAFVEKGDITEKFSPEGINRINISRRWIFSPIFSPS